MEGLELKIGDNDSDFTDILRNARRVRHWYLATIINPLYIAGLAGNLLALIVFRYMVRTSRPAARDAINLLSAVSLADAAYLVFMFEYTGNAWGLPLLELKGNFACAFIFYLRGVAGTGSILLFSSLSLSRLIILSRGPLGVDSPCTCRWLPPCLRRRADDIFGVACLVSMSAALLVNIPRLVSFRLNPSEDVPCRAHHSSRISTILHMSAHMLFQRLGPAVMISLLNLLLLLRLRHFHQLSTTQTSANIDSTSRLSHSQPWRLQRRQRRLTKACLVLGCAYVVFFVPPSIYWCCIYAWDMSKRMPLPKLQFHAVVGDTASVTATLSSAINLPVYIACLADFRATVQRLLTTRATASAPATSTPSSEASETGVSLELRCVSNADTGRLNAA